MKIFKNLKRKHYFCFKKVYLVLQNEGDEFFYRTITDSYLFSKTKIVADNTNCKLITFNRQEWNLEGYVITLCGTEDEFMNFCSEFCSTFKKYIENIEIK